MKSTGYVLSMKNKRRNKTFFRLEIYTQNVLPILINIPTFAIKTISYFPHFYYDVKVLNMHGKDRAYFKGT